MDNKKIVIEVLKQYSCLTAEEISFFAKRLFKANISAGSAAAAMRQIIGTGKGCKQTHPVKGKMVYWLTEEGKVML